MQSLCPDQPLDRLPASPSPLLPGRDRCYQCLFPAGTNEPRGQVWRRSIYGALGVLASRDQSDALNEMTRRWSYMDRGRVGMWGHSGGGSMTLNMSYRNRSRGITEGEGTKLYLYSFKTNYFEEHLRIEKLKQSQDTHDLTLTPEIPALSFLQRRYVVNQPGEGPNSPRCGRKEPQCSSYRILSSRVLA